MGLLSQDAVANAAAVPNAPTGKVTLFLDGSDSKWKTKDEFGNIVCVSDKNFVFTQGVASTTWVVAHNLGNFPSVTIVDTGGSEVEGEVTHTDVNNLTITFGAAFSGKAYIN